MKLFVLSFDFHSFLKKDISDVIPISTFVHFSLVVISLKHRANSCSIASCCICFCVAKSLTGFKLCTTSPNNMQCVVPENIHTPPPTEGHGIS